MKKSVSSLKVPHHKNTAGQPSVAITPPKEVLLPLSMHSGAPAVPVVAAGDRVLVGQLIAREDGKISSPVHASVSGTVVGIEEHRLPSGRSCGAIRIASDGKMEKDPSIKAPEPTDLDSFLSCLHGSGIVGLGGAAFPLYGKLDAAKRDHIHTVLINGAECEPFITSDHRTMVEHGDLIEKGIAALKRFLESERFVIGIEENKPDAIKSLTERFANDPAVEVMPLKSVYPQGAKQVLLYNVTGQVVEEGQRLASLGVIIINVTTLAKMALYLETGMPLVSRCVTVDGSAVREPKNLVAPVGTPISYLIEQAGGLKAEAGKILLGGPMMGVPVSDPDEPIVKATNAVLVFTEKDAVPPEPTACIHCGRCAAACPIGLNPTAYAKAMDVGDEAERLALLQKANIQLCIECGCCSYICPARRPLVQTNKEAKRFYKNAKAAEKNGGRK